MNTALLATINILGKPLRLFVDRHLRNDLFDLSLQTKEQMLASIVEVLCITDSENMEMIE